MTRIIKEKTGTLSGVAWLTVLSRKPRPTKLLFWSDSSRKTVKEYADQPERAKELLNTAPPDASLILRNWLLGPWYRSHSQLGRTTIQTKMNNSIALKEEPSEPSVLAWE